jgi:head-tail adaptor
MRTAAPEGASPVPGAGDLRDRLIFQSRGLDANGDALGEWQERFRRHCQLIWLRGGEGVVQQRIEGRQPVAIVCRKDSGTREITTAWRAVNARAEDQVFNITAVAPHKELDFLDLQAVVGGATG